MIRRVQVLHYLALKYIDIKLLNFHILVGPNASGKSTFLDVINLIKDILNENPHNAVEKRASRFDELLWNQQGSRFEIAIELGIPEDIKEKLKDKVFSLVRYEISLRDFFNQCLPRPLGQHNWPLSIIPQPLLLHTFKPNEIISLFSWFI